MTFSLPALLLWAACFSGNVALFLVLFRRQRARVVPWFAAWVGFQLVYSIALFGAYRRGSEHLYTVLYWYGAFLDLALQIAVVVEIARFVFRRGQGWVGGARRLLVWSGIVAALAGVGMGWWMTPVSTSRLDAWESRVDLGATVLIVILFTSVMMLSERLGVSWRSLVLREGYGVAAWSLVSFVTDTLHAYWRTAEHLASLEQLRVCAYLATVCYWIVVFWLPEPAPSVPDFLTKSGMDQLLREVD